MSAPDASPRTTDPADAATAAPVGADERPGEPDLPGITHAPVSPPRDVDRSDAPWWRRRPGTATMVGVLAGVALYLVVIAGEPGLALGLLLVAALALSLRGSIRSLRAARRHGDEGGPTEPRP
jgi:hypothetical protein